MRLYTLLFLMFGITLLPLSGCMMWMHGMEHDASSQKQQPAKTVVKEFAEKDVSLSLEVPPFSMGEEATLVLRVSHIQKGTPISGAKVTFVVEYIEQPGKEHAEHPAKAAAERETEEIPGKGIYQLRYKFGERGLYRITGRVWIGEKGMTTEPLTITLTQEVDQHEGHGTKKSITPWVVIGGIGMVAMMAIMVL